MDVLSKKKLEEILEKSPESLADTEKDFLKARRSYLTKKQQEDYADIFGKEEKKKTSLEELTKAQLEEKCKEAGIEEDAIKKAKNKAELAALLESK